MYGKRGHSVKLVRENWMGWDDRAQAGAEDARLMVSAGVEPHASSQPHKKWSMPASLELTLPIFVTLLVL